MLMPRLTQGIVSNDTLQLQPEDARPVYSLLLNPQGRLLHDFFLFRSKGAHSQAWGSSYLRKLDCGQCQLLMLYSPAGAQPVVLADVQKGQHEDLIRLLKKYAPASALRLGSPSTLCCALGEIILAYPPAWGPHDQVRHYAEIP